MKIYVNLANSSDFKYFYKDGVSCSVRLIHDDDALDLDVDNPESITGHYILGDMGVKSGYPAGQGAGTDVLKQAIAYADSKNKHLIVHPYARDSGLMNQEQLEQWYSKHGFVEEIGYWIRYSK